MISGRLVLFPLHSLEYLSSAQDTFDMKKEYPALEYLQMLLIDTFQELMNVPF